MLYNYFFSKENLEYYLLELAKEYRKLSEKAMPAEMILVGGASILVNYGFRETTYDLDAIIHASSAMKDAINNISDRYDLPNGWINSDFAKTKSYAPKLIEHSVFFRTYHRILTVRTVAAEYLIAMKLMSGRKYKNDLSDIIGILLEHKRLGDPVSAQRIDSAVRTLFGSWKRIPQDSTDFIGLVTANDDYEFLYNEYRKTETENRDILADFTSKYPDMVNSDNANDILAKAKQIKEKGSVTKR